MPVREGFFAFLEDIGAQGDGFALLGRTHLFMLGGLAVFTGAICFIYKRQERHRRGIMLKITALIILALEIAKQLTFPLLQGQYWVEQLPLHLCGLSIAIVLIHAFFPNKTTGEILYCLCLPGAVAALLFSNWSMYPLLSFYSLQSFFIHALLVAFPLMLLITGEIRPSAKELWRAALFLVLVVPPIYLLNIKLSTNFFFVNAGSEGSPLEIFIELAGVPYFLLPYAGLLIVIWFLMYLPWSLPAMRGR